MRQCGKMVHISLAAWLPYGVPPPLSSEKLSLLIDCMHACFVYWQISYAFPVVSISVLHRCAISNSPIVLPEASVHLSEMFNSVSPLALKIARYWYVLAIALLDFMLTIGQEVELFWKQSWKSIPFILFIANRYLVVFTCVFLSMYSFWPSDIDAGHNVGEISLLTRITLRSCVTPPGLWSGGVITISETCNDLTPNRSGFWRLYSDVTIITVQIIGGGVFSNLICWLQLYQWHGSSHDYPYLCPL